MIKKLLGVMLAFCVSLVMCSCDYLSSKEASLPENPTIESNINSDELIEKAAAEKAAAEKAAAEKAAAEKAAAEKAAAEKAAKKAAAEKAAAEKAAAEKAAAEKAAAEKAAAERADIIAEIEELRLDINFYKERIANEESQLDTYSTGLEMYQNDLDEAINQLENVKKQKTMRVYYEDRGWVWEPDPYKIKTAQESVDHYTQMVEYWQMFVDMSIESIEEYTNSMEEAEARIRELEGKL